MPRVTFPAYRRYRESRIEVNDALMALMIGARLGEHALRTHPSDPNARLPALFGAIPGIERINRTARDAARLLDEAEAHLASMGIPYVLSTHGAFLSDAIQMLRDDGKDDPTAAWVIAWRSEVTDIALSELHEYFIERSGQALPADPLAGFHLARRIRNRIIHFASEAGPRLPGEYRSLPPTVRANWERIAGRPLTTRGGKLDLGVGELNAVLALTRGLGRAVNEALVPTLSRSYWAGLLIDDYRAVAPTRFALKAQQVRRLLGYSQRRYGPVGLTEAEIRAAL